MTRVLVRELADETATLALGAELALASSALVCLRGVLGAGKTTLVRGALRSLGHSGAVPSPTYTLVERYEVGGRRVQHFDLYRLEDPAELEMLGIRDYFAEPALRLVEWPERARGALPRCDVEVELEVVGERRRAHLSAGTEAGAALLARLRGPADADEGADVV